MDGLTDEDKVIPVRLALFAEMVKDKPWTPATLRDVGGPAGVGVTFLEETFNAATAEPADSRPRAGGAGRARSPHAGGGQRDQGPDPILSGIARSVRLWAEAAGVQGTDADSRQRDAAASRHAIRRTLLSKTRRFDPVCATTS